MCKRNPQVPTTPSPTAPVSEDDQKLSELIDVIKRWRSKSSAALGIPAYRILTNATIERLAQAKPTTTDELELVTGIGPATVEQFGYDLVELIRGAFESAGSCAAEADPAVPEIAPEPIVAEPIVAEPIVAEPIVAEPIVAEPIVAEPIVAEPIVAEPIVAEPIVPEPIVAEPIKPDPKSEQSDDRGHDAISLPNAISKVETSDADKNSEVRDAADPADSKNSDAYWTWRLFRDGYSASQIAAIRRVDVVKLGDDLKLAAQAGHEIRPEWGQSSDG